MLECIKLHQEEGMLSSHHTTRSTMRVRTSQTGEARSYLYTKGFHGYLRPVKYKERTDRKLRIYHIQI